MSAPGAAFANAVAANALDVDDCGIYTWGHPGAQVVPAALAITDRGAHSGEDLLTALVVGYEIAFRAGRCLNSELIAVASAERAFRGCGAWGAPACAAIAANVARLSASQTSNALGIAEYHSPDLPIMRDVASPAMIKHGVGVGALTGLMAADLAARGFHRRRLEPRARRLSRLRRRPGRVVPAAGRHHLEAFLLVRLDAPGPAGPRGARRP